MSAAEELRKRVEVVDTAAADDLVALRLVFSRDEVLALADLLDKLADLWQVIDEGGLDRGSRPLGALVRVDTAYRALEQAITRKATP